MASGRGTATRSLAATLVVLIVSLLLAALSPAMGAGNGMRAHLASSGASAGDGIHRLGFKQAAPDAAARFGGAGRPQAGAELETRTSVDLTAQLPPVGDQGNESSCVAWATSYYYKSSVEKREHTTWNLSSA